MGVTYSLKYSVNAKAAMNSAITKSTFTAAKTGDEIKEVTLTELQNAINKLSTYITKVDNCGNCKTTTVVTTSQVCQNQCSYYRTTVNCTTTYYYYNCSQCGYTNHSNYGNYSDSNCGCDQY